MLDRWARNRHGVGERWEPEMYEEVEKEKEEDAEKEDEDEDEEEEQGYEDEEDEEDEDDEEGEEFEEEEEEGEEEGDEDDYDTDYALSQIIPSMVETLHRVQGKRAWASYGPMTPNPPVPGLFLKQYGNIGLPLSLGDASRIKKQSYQEKPSKTTRFRNIDLTCDLVPSQFELRNPAWHKFIRTAGMEATQPFDVGPVAFELRKLTLSGPDSNLDVWQDPNPGQTSFGSMMVILPSAHEGGDVKLTHKNETKTFSTATSSEFGYSFVAWFSEVQVELDPISSGCRLHLMYDLHKPMAHVWGKPSPHELSSQAGEYQALLQRWTRLCELYDAPSPLVAYILKEETKDYNDLGLCYQSLSETYRDKADFLQQQCSRNKVCFWLATMLSSIDERGDDISAPTFELVEITELDGTEVLKETVVIGRDHIADKEAFDYRDPNDSEFEDEEPEDPWEEMDSKDDDHILYFKDVVFLLVPESQRLAFLTDHMSGEDVRSWISRLSDLLHSSEDRSRGLEQTEKDQLERSIEQDRKELACVCERVITKMRSRRDNQNACLSHWLYSQDHPGFSGALQELIRATIVAKEANLFCLTVTECPKKLSPDMWRDIGKNLNDVALPVYTEGLSRALGQITALTDRYLSLQSIISGYSDVKLSLDHPLELWARTKVEEAFSSVEYAVEQDNRTLVAIGKRYGGDFLINNVVPFVKKHGTDVLFSAGFADCIFEEIAAKTLGDDLVKVALQEVFSTMIPALTAAYASNSPKRRRLSPTLNAPENPASAHRYPLTGHRYAQLVRYCVIMGLANEEHDLLMSIGQIACMADRGTLEAIFMPFLKSVRGVMDDLKIAFSSPKYQTVFRSITLSFISRFVEPEPPRPINYVCPNAGCSTCETRDCRDLDNFCKDPNRATWHLTATGARRSHIEDRIGTVRQLRCSTIKNNRAPHTLHIEKVTYLLWQEDHTAWLGRCEKATNILVAIGRDALQQLLGDMYDDCMELRSVRKTTATVIPERPSPKTHGRTHIVDLT